MQEITLNIDGRDVKGKAGDTVLTVCRNANIDIPTLCHMEGLTDVGACRLCVVEIQGERKPTPSCTYPAREGLIVKTNTPKLEKYRRQILELLFAERNHFCMYCAQSGDCELQQLAYKYQMDNVRFQGLFPKVATETLGEYLVIDHNRCVLCGRCVRTCRYISAIRAIDFSGRGTQTMISADINQPFGESSCTMCGACVQACPTGAIMSKDSLYRGHAKDCTTAETTCPGCSIGCGLSVMVKANNVVRINAADMKSAKGSLCRIGRFDLLKESRNRITSPKIRNAKGKLVDCSLDEAVEAVATKLAEQGNKIDAVVSSKCSNEAITQVQNWITGLNKSNVVDTLDGQECRRVVSGLDESEDRNAAYDPELESILKADCILVVGSDVDRTHPVMGNLIRKAVMQNKALLIVADSQKDIIPLWTDMWLRCEPGSERVLVNGITAGVMQKKGTKVIKPELKRMIEAYDSKSVSKKTAVNEKHLTETVEKLANANNVFVVCNSAAVSKDDDGIVASLFNLANCLKPARSENLNLIFLKKNANSRGAWEAGTSKLDVKKQNCENAYLLLSDDTVGDKWLEWLKSKEFVVVQTSYETPATEFADVVIPSRIWAERSGTYTANDGKKLKASPVLEPRYQLASDEEIIKRFTAKPKAKATRK